MPMYKTCPYCGAHLDPGEKCDCQDRESKLPEIPAEKEQEVKSA